jgi:hypothetical protein
MKFLDLKDLAPHHYKAFSQSRELTAEEKAEIVRLYMAELSEADLQEYADWDKATPFEDFLRQLKDEQRRWDEQSQ